MSWLFSDSRPDIVGDLLIIAAVFVAALVLDALHKAWKRKGSGRFRLSTGDFSDWKLALAIASIAVLVAVSQSYFSWLGYQTRDDVPYFLGLLAMLAIISFALKWFSDKNS